MKYLLIVLLLSYLLLSCDNPELDEARRVIKQSEDKYRSDSILIERQTQIKIEEYKAKK